METKVCKKCEVEKDVSCFSKHVNVCRDCINFRNRQNRFKNITETHLKEKERRQTQAYKDAQLKRKEKVKKLKTNKLSDYALNLIEKSLSSTKNCSICNLDLDKSLFYKSSKVTTVGGLSSSCKQCIKLKPRKISEKTIKMNEIYKQELETDTKYCSKCKNFFSLNNFQKSLKDRYGLDTYCKKCKFILRDTITRRIHKNTSTRMSQVFKENNTKKNFKTFLTLGYTEKELMDHLEEQFTSEMNWNNYGSYWHIDHIIPVSYFKIESPFDNDFKLCWRLENLRPLEASENMQKGDKILEEFKYLLENNDINRIKECI